MSLSLEEAVQHVYANVLHRDETAPLEQRTIIFDDATIEKHWGWVFFFNNEKYYRTRNPSDAHIGAGPLFLNRQTCEIRRFGSGGCLADEVFDYEMELEAAGRHWCLRLAEDQDRRTAILKLKALLKIDLESARNLVPRLPSTLFTGIRRHLDWMKVQLEEVEVASYIVVQRHWPDCIAFRLPSRFERVSNIRAHHAFHDEWRPDW